MAKKNPTPGRRAAKARAPVTFAAGTLTIRFDGEADLRDKLAQLLSMFDGTGGVGATGAAAALADAVTPCVPLLKAADIVVAALAPKNFSPAEKLGTTYLLSQERELFRDRVVDRIAKAGCTVSRSDVPSGASTTHSDVVGAIRDKARS